ncbi:transcription initiation factor TFIID subunit 4-like [Mustela lutreola]|uniref:transcription initiation factor TFIID subunit 4-like n=1 Tax=Mustela lutreola TaxID=9666 RepID=UPI0027976DF6|nr:transcription initiation factor TFIID subunit 4-like [Mustela lutreola]
MSKPRTKCRGERARGKSDPSPHSSKIRILASSAPGSRSLALAPSPPRSQHPHRDARITPGRRPPPSAPPAAAPSFLASSPPPQLSGRRAGSLRAGGGGRGASPGAPGPGPGPGLAAGAARRGASPDRRQRRGGRAAAAAAAAGLAQSPVSYTTSGRSEQPLREDVQPQPSSLQPLGTFR